MTRRLVTCPICQVDCHTYKGKIARHNGLGAITCLGSGEKHSASQAELVYEQARRSGHGKATNPQ